MSQASFSVSLMLTNRNESYAGTLNEYNAGTIEVLPKKDGPTERELAATALRTLNSEPGNALCWGYAGGGATTAAIAILKDVQGVEPPQEMALAFVDEVLSQVEDTWRMSAASVVRWIDSWEKSGRALNPHLNKYI